MTDLQAIEKRISRRSYINSAIDKNKVDIIKSLISQINEQSRLNIAFTEDAGKLFNGFLKSYGMFTGVNSVIMLKGKPNDKNLHEKAGYFGERLVLEATKLGLGTCWVGGSFDKKFVIKNLPLNEEIVCVITVGNVPDDKTAREKLIYKVTHRKTKGISDIFFSKEPVPDWFIFGIKAVLKAPSAVNRQKVFFEYNDNTATAFIDKKYELGLVDLGIAKLHFEISAGGKFSVGNPGKFLIGEPVNS